VSICHESDEVPYCPKFCQLIIKKIIRIVATRCQILGGKNVQNSISAGELTALLLWWSLQHPLTHWLHLRAPLLRVGEGREGKRRRKGGSKKVVCSPNLHHRSTPLKRAVGDCNEEDTDGRARVTADEEQTPHTSPPEHVFSSFSANRTKNLAYRPTCIQCCVPLSVTLCILD